MRTSPNSQAGTIRILEYGESVAVTNTFGFDSSHQDQSGWYDGHWIYVTTDLGAGYVFDAYLSTLAVPDHEDELCFDSFRFAAPLTAYLNHHYPARYDEQGVEHTESVDQCITYYEEDITGTSTRGEGWHKTDLVFREHRLSEVVNLFRGMIVGEETVQFFENSLIFHRDANGRVNRVQAGSAGNPIHIKLERDGSIHVSFIEFEGIDGC
jgi:hypothetical protein